MLFVSSLGNAIGVLLALYGQSRHEQPYVFAAITSILIIVLLTSYDHGTTKLEMRCSFERHATVPSSRIKQLPLNDKYGVGEFSAHPLLLCKALAFEVTIYEIICGIIKLFKRIEVITLVRSKSFLF